jgi:2-dehydropantoate 2-reductase
MKIAVMGAGGQGGLFGGLLWRAGEDVTLVARGRHLEAIKSQGLTLKTAEPTAFIVDIAATDDPAAVGQVDLLLFCVKMYHLEAAAVDAGPLVGPDTVILPVQNGIVAPDRLGEIFGADRVLGGVSYHQGTVEGPGVISYGRVKGNLYLGELGGGSSPRTDSIGSVLDDAGIDAEVHTNIRVAMWRKFVLICATGGVLAYYRKPIGPVLDDPDGRALLLGAMEEVESVARARGIGLPEAAAESTLAFIENNSAPDTRSSQLEDILAGRKLELEWLNGEVVRLGRELGIPTPLNLRIYEALKPYVDGPV